MRRVHNAGGKAAHDAARPDVGPARAGPPAPIPDWQVNSVVATLIY